MADKISEFEQKILKMLSESGWMSTKQVFDRLSLPEGNSMDVAYELGYMQGGGLVKEKIEDGRPLYIITDKGKEVSGL